MCGNLDFCKYFSCHINVFLGHSKQMFSEFDLTGKECMAVLIDETVKTFSHNSDSPERFTWSAIYNVRCRKRGSYVSCLALSCLVLLLKTSKTRQDKIM